MKHAWAIETPEFRLLGHGWFGWVVEVPHVNGCRIALWRTRREARQALREKVRSCMPKARVVRVIVIIKVDR